MADQEMRKVVRLGNHRGTGMNLQTQDGAAVPEALLVLEGDEGQAAVLEGGDDGAEGLDGLGAVAAVVAEQQVAGSAGEECSADVGHAGPGRGGRCLSRRGAFPIGRCGRRSGWTRRRRGSGSIWVGFR